MGSTKDGIRAKNSTKEITENEQIPDVRSFREQAILVINILASQGIDLYDPARTPGMYLKRRGTAKVPDAIINKILTEERPKPTRKNQPTPVEKHTEVLPQGLLNFMTKKK